MDNISRFDRWSSRPDYNDGGDMKLKAKVLLILTLFCGSFTTAYARSAPCPDCGRMTVNTVSVTEYHWEWENCTHGYPGHQDNVYYKYVYSVNQCSACGTVVSKRVVSKTEVMRAHDQIGN